MATKNFIKLKRIIKLFIIFSATGLIVSYLIVKNIQSQLPPVSVLKDIKLQTPLRIFSADGKLMAEFGEKRRIPVDLTEVPKNLINAVIATEDNRFYEHAGVDVIGLSRAALKLAANRVKSQGGSTITMQVARNFFLSRKKTYTRKLNEILLAIKIEQELTKDEILSLYLNEIFLGHRAYGVAAAAQAYYGKELNQLTLAECAMLAGLPKAPSAINPISNPEAATNRRNYVLSRMHHYGYISDEEYNQAINTPVNAQKHEVQLELHAPYVTEMVRYALVKRWGEDVYTAGLQIYTTIDSKLQNHANQATKEAVIKYEQRHGYRGAEDNWGTPTKEILPTWVQKLKNIPHVPGLESGVVLNIHDLSESDAENETEIEQNYVTILNNQNQIIKIDWSGLSWARQKIKNSNLLGKKPTLASEILKPGDLIKFRYDNTNHKWALSQIPAIEAALIAINPQNGKIVALTGGYDFYKSKFNRITQAYRQAGSSLKPFIYSAALEKGFTAASVFNDAPIVMDDPEQEALWRPQNSSKQFYGPTRLRTALVKSRNLVSIRLLQAIGIDYTHEFLQRFGFRAEQIPNSLSLALGTTSVTPLQLGQAYSTFANGGYAINPIMIKKITDGNEEVLYQLNENNDNLAEHGSDFEYYEAQNSVPNNQQIIPPQNAYLINSMLMDAIKTGTGQQALQLKRGDIAGKTGTSSDNFDAWYCGFTPNLVTITWMGFDQPKSIHEYAATTALPMWIDFMGQALKELPEQYLPMPDGLISVRIDPASGLLADSKQTNSLFELFVSGTEPKEIVRAEDKIYNVENNTASNAEQTTRLEESITAEQIF